MTLRLLALLLALVIPASTGAQPSVAADETTAAAEQPPPPERPGVVTRVRTWARSIQLRDRLFARIDGWYPRIGGITRGSGFAAGPGYRAPVFGGALYLDASAAFSMRGYKAFDAHARLVQAPEAGVELWTEFRYEDFPQEDFFGLGMASALAMRTSYDFDSTELLARLIVKPVPWLRLDASTGVVRPDVGSGTDENYPSIEERFGESQAPGILDQPNFLHTTLTAAVDRRDRPTDATRGGWYRVSYGIWNDVEHSTFDFHAFDAQLRQYLPIVSDGSHVLSGRAGVRYVHNEPGDRVPFYFLAHVGGRDTIRSFREFRFKDVNTAWLGAEYQWRLRPRLSLSVFGDAGQAQAHWDAMTWDGMRTGYGFALGLHSSTRTLARIDVGTGGGEGWQYFLSIDPGF